MLRKSSLITFLISLGFQFLLPLTVEPVEAVTLENPQKLRVIEVRYFADPNDIPYHPDTLSAQLQKLMEDSSAFHLYKDSTATPSIDVEVVEVYNHNEKRPNTNGDWYTTYEDILKRDNLCQRIKDLDIDQLWLWVDPRKDTGPGWEFVISSNYFQQGVQNAIVANPAFCGGDPGFVFMGFDYSRTADLALHSIGHYMEGKLTNLQTSHLFWQRFSGDDSTTYSRKLRCGNVHFPPNGVKDYDYANRTNVNTSCEDWNPDATGQKIKINCNRWGCNQEGYLKWWLQNMPNRNNGLKYEGKLLPNWWSFTVDMDDTIAAYAADTNYFMNHDFLNANKPSDVDYPDYYQSTSIARQNSGTSLSVSHDVSGENRLLVLSASYRASINNTAHITAATYAGQNMTFLRRDKYHDFTTEVWYMVTPPVGTGQASVTFSADPEDQVIAASSYVGIDQTTPIMRHAGAGSTLLDSGNPGYQSITVESSTNEAVVGVLSVYPDGGSNNATNLNDTLELWEAYTSNNNIGSYGGTEPGAPTVTLEWKSNKNWPWAMSAASLLLAPVQVEPSIEVTTTTDKTEYISGQDTFANVQVSVEDENNQPVTGLGSTNFSTTVDDVASTVVFTETATLGTYVATLDISAQSTGTHTVAVTVTDSRSLTSTGSTSYAIVAPLTDIAVSSITAPSSVKQGELVTVGTTIANVGNQSVSGDITVELLDETDGFILASQTISGGLVAGTTKDLQFNWDTSLATLGDHTITVRTVYADENSINNSKSATVTVNPPYSSTDMGVYNIGWQSGVRHLDVTVNIRRDSATDGILSSGDAVVGGATVGMVLTHDTNGNGTFECGSGDTCWTYSGTTDSSGNVSFRRSSASAGRYQAKVTQLSATGLNWRTSIDLDNPDSFTR